MFYATHKDFEDFTKFMVKCEKLAGDSAIFKVVPPKGWVPRKDNYKNIDPVLKYPIEQNVSGNGGFYELVYFVRESRLLSKYRNNVETYDKILENKTKEEIEKLFWRTLKMSPPLYGADVPAESLFDPGVPFNLNEL